MVCIYCGSPTQVTNSRLQKQANQVWRRRRCTACQAMFTTLEHSAYETALVVQLATSHIIPFERDMLFLSIYDALRHRKTALADATALTATVMGKLAFRHGLITRASIVESTSAALKHFDTAAFVQYQAYHPL